MEGKRQGDRDVLQPPLLETLREDDEEEVEEEKKRVLHTRMGLGEVDLVKDLSTGLGLCYYSYPPSVGWRGIEKEG